MTRSGTGSGRQAASTFPVPSWQEFTHGESGDRASRRPGRRRTLDRVLPPTAAAMREIRCDIDDKISSGKRLQCYTTGAGFVVGLDIAINFDVF